MKNLTIISIGNSSDYEEFEKYEIIHINNDNYTDALKIANGYYIVFIKEGDKISDNYLSTIMEKTEFEFDAYFINYDILYSYKNKMKTNRNLVELQKNRPYFGEYIWSFVYKKEKLIALLNNKTKEDWNSFVDENFKEVYAFGDTLYYHNPNNKPFINNGPLLDNKINKFYKNLIYMGNGCNGIFNGYISWLINLGRCFSQKYDITILYDEMPELTCKTISKYFKCIKIQNNTNYVCDILLTTYSTYFYPKNIFALENTNLFIHGNMCDYNAIKYVDDIYTNYIAVSKIAAQKAKGYFPTNNIKSIPNPFKLDKSLLKPHLKLTSALRYSNEKCPERIELMGKLLEELNIPYTWNVFTDQKENTNESGGLIFRNRVINPLPYINDSDYFVLLSNSEAMPYCVLEALACNTKLILTPLDAYKEIGIENNKNAIIIPFDYFEEKNKEKLIAIIKKIYEEKNKIVHNTINTDIWKEYNNIFKE